MSSDKREQRSGSPSHVGLISVVAGFGVSAVFYGAVYVIPWQPLQRYFLGHPVAVAATVLFWIAVAILTSKWVMVSAQWDRLHTTRDEDISPPTTEQSPAGRWKGQHDAGYVARRWMSALAELPRATRSGALVGRLNELLTRQSQRGTTKHLADDLRELSSRDADNAHDSLGLVRIIVWAIPMLGFLGTVIGITQTLGGLDFTDGTAAVDRLKSGLYIAFDTTALGLVLSVVAIFLQFPVERSEQRLLGEIDARVGHLMSSYLPSDDASDDQTALVGELCEGIRAAVAESLAGQTKLWRQTIDEAQSHWQAKQESNGQLVARSLEQTFQPALLRHAEVLTESAQNAGDRIERQFTRWQEAMASDAETLAAHHQLLSRQCDQLAGTHQQTEAVLAAQQVLDANLTRLQETNAAIDHSVKSAAGDGMADAMRTLARAVDMLATQLQSTQASDAPKPRRAA